jgi:hypothetical protein
MAEAYRQFAFVSSVLGGFAFLFFAAILPLPATHRSAPWAAGTALAAAIGLLTVTLGSTFSAAALANLPAGASVPPAIAGHHRVLSLMFLGSLYVLLVSFGVSGFIRSKRMGRITVALAVAGAISVAWVISPFVS